MPKAPQLWYGEIPDIFGYGISALGYSHTEVMFTLKKSYAEWKKAYPDESTTFRKSFEYYGGWVEPIEIGKAYYGGLRS